MSLMMLGPVSFDMKLNPQKLSRSSEASFAVHDVVGAAPVREDMGEGDTTYEITGVIYPHHFGGLEGLAALDAARKARIPLPYMRGTLSPVGWVVIEKLTVDEEEIGQFGVGMEINFTASLAAVETPSPGMAGSILSLLR